MDTFGKRLRGRRKERGFYQNEPAIIPETNHPVIGKYERDEVKPPINVVKKLSKFLETTFGLLPGEDENQDL